MPAPFHGRYRFKGKFGAGSTVLETWEWGLNTQSPGPITLAGAKAFSDAGFAAWTQHLAPLHPLDVVLTEVQYAVISGTGRVDRLGSGEFMQNSTFGAQPGSDAPIDAVPLQTATVVSLGTQRQGSTGKGRVFLPMTTVPVDETHRFTNAAQVALLGSFKAFLLALNAAGPDIVVASDAASVLSPVTAIRVGRVPDTQRRRRSDLPEEYEATNL